MTDGSEEQTPKPGTLPDERLHCFLLLSKAERFELLRVLSMTSMGAELVSAERKLAAATPMTLAEMGLEAVLAMRSKL